MENFFTNVKARTNSSTWRKHDYGNGPRGCLAGLMGVNNQYIFDKLVPADRELWAEAYEFATNWLRSNLKGHSVERFNDAHAKSLADIHQVLDELALAWEEIHPSETESQKKAKTWLEEVQAAKQDCAEKGWLSIERSFDQLEEANEKPMAKRFAAKVEGWLRSQPVEEKEKELV